MSKIQLPVTHTVLLSPPPGYFTMQVLSYHFERPIVFKAMLAQYRHRNCPGSGYSALQVGCPLLSSGRLPVPLFKLQRLI